MRKKIIFKFHFILLGFLGIVFLNQEPHKIPLADYIKQTKARMPAAAQGLDVTIAAGDIVKITESTNINHLVINGELHCDEVNADSQIVLQAKSIKVNGVFKCGSVTNPYGKKLIISLKHSSLDPKVDHRYRGLVVVAGGKLELFGNRKNAKWFKLSQTLHAGENFLFLANGLIRQVTPEIPLEFAPIETSKKSPQKKLSSKKLYKPFKLGWKIGDKIVVSPTGYNSNESETFTITGFDKTNHSKVLLDRAATYTHYGKRQILNTRPLGNFNLDERAEVANLTRSIVIRGDESSGPILETDTVGAERGGHVMIHYNGEAYIDSVEFYKMGQAGVMARYPFHWHFVGDGTGQFVRNSSVHHSFQRCYVIHRTQNVDLINNVCYNFKGHGYFLEDGNETGNRIIRNLAISARAPFQSKILLQSDSIATSETQGRFPSVSGFWISNPDNHISHNIVTGSVGSGFWMAFEKEVKNNSGVVIAEPIKTDTDVFNYNTARSSRVGITWDGAPGWKNANNPNNPKDKILANAHYRPQTVPIFKGLKAYKNIMTGIYFRGQTVVFKNAVMADNGWGAWVAYNQIFQDSVFVGKTDNYSAANDDFFFANAGRTSRYRRNGITLYDGPFEVHGSDFINFSTTEQSRVINGRSEVTTYVPFTSTGGTNKYVNFTSDLEFTPEPIHRIHTHTRAERSRETPMLGNSSMRDLDGTLTGIPGGMVIGERSLAQDHRCSPGGITYKNHLLCDATFTEGSFTYMRWGGPVSPWSTPYVAVRSDGVSNYPINEWNSLLALPNNAITTPNSTNKLIKLLPRYQFYYDNQIGTTAKIEANSESENPISPIIKIVAYGYNCELDDDAIRVNSIGALYSATHTSYYSNEEDFYVRLIPHERWRMYSDTPYIQSTANATNYRYKISCDPEPIEKEVKGRITNVSKTRDNLIIEGWACNFTQASSINTKLYIGNSPALRGFYYIDQDYASDPSNEKIGIECGSARSNGRRFKYIISNQVAEQYGVKQKIYVKGISNSGGTDKYLKGSGQWNVLGKRHFKLDPVRIPAKLSPRREY